jgi:hypothetical protein
MRVFALTLSGMAALAPAALMAQSFEGAVTGAQYEHGKAKPVNIEVKGRRWRMLDDRGDGLISDGAGLMMVDASERVYRRMPNVFDGVSAAMRHIALTPSGKHETVAGQDCQYYTASSAQRPSESRQVCITQAFGLVGIEGAFNYCTTGGTAAMRSEFTKGCFVLKVLDQDGSTEYAVAKIDRRPVSDADFGPPAGYSEMKD